MSHTLTRLLIGGLGLYDGWRTVAAVAGASGAVLIGLYWQRQLILGLLLTAACFLVVILTDWPGPSVIGA